MIKQKPKIKIYFDITAEKIFWSLMIGSLVAGFYCFILNKDSENFLYLGAIIAFISSFLSAWNISTPDTHTTAEPMGEARLSKQVTEPKPVEPLTIAIEYHNGSVESIDMTYNLEELQDLFSQAMQNGSGINFTNFDPVTTINPRCIKKVTFLTHKEKENGIE